MSLEVDIQKRYRGFSLSVRFSSNGAPLGILGASGSGKSITLKCIAGILSADAGRIVLNGRVLFDSARKINLKPQQRRIGYLFQNYALFPNMTVAENLLCALPGQRAAKQRALGPLLCRYRLQGLEHRYPAQLSGGQQQRVALARILAYEPEALLLDEPFSALDSHLKETLQLEMMEHLQDYAGDAVMVTHSRDEVYKLSQNLLFLENGHSLAYGGTREMFQNPGVLAAARLTGCKNFSRAAPAGKNAVHALDWGLTLPMAAPLPQGLSHIGVRAHYLHPCTAAYPGAIAVKTLKTVESPFEWNILLACRDTGAHLWWKVPKEELPDELPQYLAVAAEDILPLT